MGMVGGGGLAWALPFGLARAAWPPGPGRVLVLASLWTLSDFARAHVFTGFPWALIGYVWVETPVIQASALVGPYLLGFLTLLAGLLPGSPPRAGAPRRRSPPAGVTAPGGCRCRCPPGRSGGRLVQANAGRS
jgi:apolipoprotein N-acyltransferase